MRRSVLCALALTPLLAAAASPARDWKDRTLASASPFIDKANAEWARAIVAGDKDALSAPYASNGVFIGPDGTAIHGRAGVRTMYARRPAHMKVIKASIRSDGRAAPDPDDVYEWGSAQMTVRQGMRVRELVGRFLTVWHREGKRWLITHNIAF